MVAAPRSRPDVEELACLVLSFVDQARAHMEESVAEFDLSAAQAKVLRYLTARGPVPMRELADTLACDASNITGIVDRLEARGLVERRLEAGDRRVRTLVLTDDGRRVAGLVWDRLLERLSGICVLDGADGDAVVRVFRRLGGDAGGRAAAAGEPVRSCWRPAPANGSARPARR